ncbi:NADH-quinone oxidoreductase subunit C [Streptomyces sp. NPDC056527]|uniref:NADH-quinone oxidoreductase subunit C n=1 Tax=Streptomyces sp. NPDC056527 TaxID=3345853 RepID=UPI00368D7381
MNAHGYDTLPEAVTEIFGEEATAERAYDLLTVDVPVGSWIASLEIARDKLGCTYFDWLSAVDEPGVGFRVCAHVVALEGGAVRRLLVRTTVPHAAATLPTAVEIYAGAEWHERETHEMFGVEFTGHPNLVPLLLPENFEGHPLRKDFVLAARVAKAWPGAKEPGESEHGGPKRRQMLPPGVPDPNDWGPMKGQLPPAPARPARAAAGDRPARAAAGDRPPRRTRTAADGSATQAPEPTAQAAEPGTPEAPARPPRRTRTTADGSASQAAEAAEPSAAPVRPPRRSRTAADGSASQAAEPVTPEGEPSEPETPAQKSPRTRSADAPWHHARPAYDDKPETTPPTPETKPTPTPEAEPTEEPTPTSAAEPAAESAPAPEAEPTPEATPAPEAEPAEERAPAPDAEPTPEAAPAPDRAPAPESEPTPEAAPAPESAAEATPAPETEPTPEAAPAPEPASGATGAPDASDPTDPTTPAGGEPA